MRSEAARAASKAVTISDVARAAGVSSATVSRVVNGLATVDHAIAERVRATIAELHYSPSNLARSLSLGVTKTVGMIVPDLGNPMFQQILNGFNRAAAADGYRVLVTDSQETVADEADLVREARKRTDAVVLCAPRTDAAALSRLLLDVQPAVVINRAQDGGSVPVVSVDYATGIRSLAEHLASLGHRHILFLAGPSRSASNRARQLGLKKFAEERPDITVSRAECGPTLDDGYNAWETVRSSGATAVLAFNDIVALGLLGRLREENVLVPEQLSVTGFDDIQFARFSSPPLTTMAVPQSLMGETAWQELRSQLRAEAPRMSTLFTPQLIVRESTGAPA